MYNNERTTNEDFVMNEVEKTVFFTHLPQRPGLTDEISHRIIRVTHYTDYNYIIYFGLCVCGVLCVCVGSILCLIQDE